MDIEVYTFEDKDGHETSSWSTQNPREAREYGQHNGYRVIANIFTFEDSELVWDFAT